MRKSARLLATAVALAGLVVSFSVQLRADDANQSATQPDFKGSPAAHEATVVYLGAVTKADADDQAATVALQAQRNQKLDAARKEYIALLKGEQAEQAKKGNLDLAVQLRDFVAAFEAIDANAPAGVSDAKPKTFNGSPAAQMATAKYRVAISTANTDYQTALAAIETQRTQQLGVARKDYLTVLKSEQLEQTKKGNLDLAVEIRAAAAAIEASACKPLAGASDTVHLVYDWTKPNQLSDWHAETNAGEAMNDNPKLVAGSLVFQGTSGVRMRLVKKVTIRSMKLELEVPDNNQAFDILWGGDGLRLHFRGSSICSVRNDRSYGPKVSAKLQNHAIVANCDISKEGNATLDVGGSRVSVDGLRQGDFLFEIEQGSPFEIKSIIIDGTIPQLSDNSGWTVLFRSADPSIWNTNTNKSQNSFAIPLKNAPEDIQYLKLALPNGDCVIIPMSNQNLGERAGIGKGRYGWDGRSKLESKAFHLGIFDSEMPGQKGSVVSSRGNSGWGYGSHAFVDDVQGFGWEGKELGRTVFEISVKITSLTEDEKKNLKE